MYILRVHQNMQFSGIKLIHHRINTNVTEYRHRYYILPPMGIVCTINPQVRYIIILTRKCGWHLSQYIRQLNNCKCQVVYMYTQVCKNDIKKSVPDRTCVSVLRGWAVTADACQTITPMPSSHSSELCLLHFNNPCQGVEWRPKSPPRASMKEKPKTFAIVDGAEKWPTHYLRANHLCKSSC